MTIESVSFPNDLNVSYPAATDPRNEGDDHIRNIKTAIKAVFPGMAGRGWRFQSKSANYTLTTTDNMSVISSTAVITLSVTAAATLGNGFAAIVYATSGIVTVDPNSSETVNGSATLVIASGDCAIIFSDGTNLHMFTLPVYLAAGGNSTWTPSANANLTLNASYAVQNYFQNNHLMTLVVNLIVGSVSGSDAVTLTLPVTAAAAATNSLGRSSVACACSGVLTGDIGIIASIAAGGTTITFTKMDSNGAGSTLTNSDLAIGDEISFVISYRV